MAAVVDNDESHEQYHPSSFAEWGSNSRPRVSNDDVPPLVGTRIPETPFQSLEAARSSIRKRFEDAMVRAEVLGGTQSRPFLSASKLKEIITQTSVEAVLSKHCPRLPLARYSKRFSKMFAILLLIEKADYIPQFIAAGVTDAHLPLRPVQGDSRKSSQVQSVMQSFLETQWALVPHSFAGPDPQTLRAPFDDIDKNAILPFTRVERFNSGSFGSVHRVEILEEYCNFGKTRPKLAGCPMNPKNLPCHFAIKELHSMDERDWSQEIEVLQSLNGEAHPNIIPLLSTYRMGGKFHLVFPWADSDLNMFWRLNPQPKMNPDLSHWMWRQMLGLVDGLSLLHGYMKDDGPRRRRWIGRHGDIKPSNILVFSGNTGEDSVFVISDFGLSSIHRAGTQAESHKVQTNHTPAYRAPEIDLNPHENSSSYDIWGLGCVFAEFLVWSVWGASALDRLASARADTTSDAPSHGSWFYLKNTNGGHQVAALKPGIEDFFHELRIHPHATDFIHDLADVVERMMLVVDPRKRSSSRDVWRALSLLSEKLEGDELYSTPRCDCTSPHTHGDWLAGAVDDQCEEHGHLLKMATPPFFVIFDMNRTLLTVGIPQVYSKASSGGKRKWTETGDTLHSDKSESKKVYGLNSENTANLPRRFACPCLRAGIDRSQLSRSCFGPGWIEIHRLKLPSIFKEHIYRCHTPETFRNSSLVCPRCLEGFESQALLMQHQRQEQCLIKATEIINGRLNLEQVNDLRSTKKKSDLTDEEKWFEYFRIIFPSYDLPLSPYHEDLTVSSINTLSTQSSTGMSEYRHYINQPLSQDKQQRIEATLAAKGIPPEYRKIMAATFRDLQFEDLEEFNQDRLNPIYDIPLEESVSKVDAAPEDVAGLAGSDSDEDFKKYLVEWDQQVSNWAS